MASQLWHLGYPEQALALSRAAITTARALGPPAPLAWALALVGWVHRLRREPAAARALATELLALATDHGFGIWVAQGTFELGWALAAEGRVDEGRALMQEGIERYGATGARLHHAGSVIAQIEVASEARENRAAALATIADLLATVELSRQRCHEPALYRLKGELVLDVTGDASAAEACFQRARDVAARQRAKLPDLRAAMSLARLWERRGKASDALAMLA